MTTAHVYTTVSLDGFVARADGGTGWLTDGAPFAETDVYSQSDFMADKDGIVMGRRCFESAADFAGWPHDRPVAVLSSTLTGDDIPRRLRDLVRLLSGPPPAVLAALAEDGWTRASIEGAETTRRFLAAGCVAELVLTRMPVLIGAGQSIFGGGGADLWLTHAWTRSYSNGFVQTRYVAGRRG